MMKAEAGSCVNCYRNPEMVCRRTRAGLRASLTIEGAFVLPLFLMACVLLISFMDAVRLQSRTQLSLSNKARRLAVAAGVSGAAPDGIWIDLIKDETWRWPVRFPGIPDLVYAARARVYPWIGSENGLGDMDPGEDSGDSEYVFMTDWGSVYHTHEDCTHLDLAVYETSLKDVKNLRNAYGRRYRKCRGFPDNYSGPVYVSEKGDYYYPSTDYGSLTRHIHIVPKDEASGLQLCSRCAALTAREEKHSHAA